MTYITSGVSMWDRPFYQNMSIDDSDNMTENLPQDESLFSLIAEQIPAFVLSLNLLREVKIKSPNFRQIPW